MGRHSAPDDEDAAVDSAVDGAEGATDVLVEDAPRLGRHAAAEPAEAEQAGTAETEQVDAAAAERDTAEAEQADTAETTDAAGVAGEQRAAPVPARTARATNADLHLLRQNPTLRARCAAAVVVPFVLYTAVLLVVGEAGRFLLWMWVPTVTAGIVAGAFLDRAARTAASEPVRESVEADEPTTSESPGRAWSLRRRRGSE